MSASGSTEPVQTVTGSVRNIHAAALSPLRQPLFRSLWIAAVISYIGTWMQNVGAGWLMASLTASSPHSSLMVALIQTANTLPVFLIILPAGAMADMVDRRRLLLITQGWMTIAAAGLGALTLAGLTTPWILIAFTFLLGFGAVMNDPAWQAITPDIVDQEHLGPAVALNSAGYNVARTLGPGFGGLIVALLGPASAFLLNAASFLGVIGFLLKWKRRPHMPPASKEHVLGSILTGLRHSRTSPHVKAVLARTAAFSVFAIALWAMLPLLALAHGSVGYGALLASLGAGALLGAALLPVARHHMQMNAIVAVGTVLYALATGSAGYIGNFGLLCAVLVLAGGVGWIALLVSLNHCAQVMSPPFLRARSISLYLLVLQGGFAVGSVLWGAVADRIGVANSLAVAAVGLLCGLMIVSRYHLSTEGAIEPQTPIEM